MPTLKPITWKNKPVVSSAHMAAVRYQLTRLGSRRRTAPGVSPVWALVLSQLDARRQARRYRQWRETRAAAACPGLATRSVAIDDAVAL